MVLWQGRARVRRRGLAPFGPATAVCAGLSGVVGALLLAGSRSAPGLGAMWSLGLVLLVPAGLLLLIAPLRLALRWFVN